MHACMVSYSYYEGDNRVRRYAETLVEKGWDVDVIALKSDNVEYPFVLKDVNVYGIQKRTKNETRKASYLLKTLKFFLLATLFLTKKNFIKKYDLIHIHSVPDFLVFSALIPKLTGSKVILDIHDIVPELYCAKFKAKQGSLIFKLLVQMEKLSVSFANHVIIANHIWHNRIIGRSVKEEKCSVVLNYPDENIFGGITRKRSDDNFIMLYPGTLSKHQGIDVAIRAVSQLKDKIPRLQFHIYGSGTDECFLKSLSKELALEERVKFFKPVALEEIAKVMADADIGIEPKRKDGFSNEAFSTKILEFMLLGVPVIASDTDIHKYYLDSSVVKYFEAGNVEDLAKSIELFHNNNEIRERYLNKSRTFIHTMRWSVREQEYLSILQKIFPNFSELNIFSTTV